jgi:N-acetylglucosamine kinase-like BadF-type ATPase
MAFALRAVGVDNGGTWIRLCGIDSRGKRIWSHKKPSPTVEKLPFFLQKSLSRFHGKLPILAIGSRGVWKVHKKRQLKRALLGLAKKIVVMSDVEAAWIAAFGKSRFGSRVTRLELAEPETRNPKPETGVVVIAGTGSIAYGRCADGRFARAGGLGPQKGDEGSGYWIGREWLMRRGSKRTTRNVRSVAALAPDVIRKANSGDPLARKIIDEAQHHLAQLVLTLADKLFGRKITPLSVSGGLFGNPSFKNGFLDEMRRLGLRYLCVPRKREVAVALARYAYDAVFAEYNTPCLRSLRRFRPSKLCRITSRPV